MCAASSVGRRRRPRHSELSTDRTDEEGENATAVAFPAAGMKCNSGSSTRSCNVYWWQVSFVLDTVQVYHIQKVAFLLRLIFKNPCRTLHTLLLAIDKHTCAATTKATALLSSPRPISLLQLPLPALPPSLLATENATAKLRPEAAVAVMDGQFGRKRKNEEWRLAVQDTHHI